MFEIGNSLREARLRQGFDLARVEDDTKVRAKYLQALEDERFEVLPAETYVKGFLRTYAEYLGLDGQLMDERGHHSRWDRDSLSLHLLSIQMRGILLVQTESLFETIRFLGRFAKWLEKADGYSLDYRPHAEKSQWGTVEAGDYQSYFLQGLPQTGPKTAAAILATVGFPFALTCTEEELLAVPGVGPAWIERLRKVFKDEGSSDDSL
jgi:hypothetical protein